LLVTSRTLLRQKKSPEFDSFPADKLRLWKKEIPDDQDDLLSNLILNDEPELRATREIGGYWTEKPPKRNIHVIVEPPESTATSSQEVLELREKLASLQALFSKSTHDFDVVVHPKRKSNKWTANIETATLEDFKKYIRDTYKPPALENDGAELNLMNETDRYYPRSDVSFREMLRTLVTKNKPKFTVFVETPSKPFNTWTFPKMCKLYGLSDDPNPSIDVYPIFSCGCVNTKEEKYKEALRKLFDELETRVSTTPIDVSYEATKSVYSYSFLASAVFPFKSQIKIVPEKLVEGKNGRGNLDFGIEPRTTGRIVGLIEVKKDDFKQGLAQATVQMESSLGRKTK